MSITLKLKGVTYDRWTSASCERDLDEMAGKFEFTLAALQTDEFGYPYPEIQADTEVVIEVDGQLFLTGAIDKREDTGDSTSYKLVISGRSKTRNAIDSSAEHISGQFNKQKTGKIVKETLKNLDLGFVDEHSDDEQNVTHRVYESESASRFIRRATREAGKNITDNEKGELVSFKAGSKGQGGALQLGVNIIEYTVSQDWTKRVKKVTAKGQSISTDAKYGKAATDNAGEAIDEFVKSARTLRILTDNDQDVKKLKKRALAEVRRRAGQSLAVTIEVHTHTDVSSGKIWTPNTLHQVTIPRADMEATLLLKSVKFTQKHDEHSAELNLTPKGAYSTDKDDTKSGGKGSKVFDSTGTKDLGKAIE